MPTYEYKAIDPKKSCSYCKNGFTQVESIKASRCKKCPRCSSAVKTVFSPPVIAEKGLHPEKKTLSDKNLSRHGFTKLVKEEKGKYRKVT